MLKHIAKALGRTARTSTPTAPMVAPAAPAPAAIAAALAPAAEPTRRHSVRKSSLWPTDSHSTFEERRRELRKASRRREVPAHELEMPGPREQAAELLAWLQSEGGRTGEIFAFELAEMLSDLCAERRWQPQGWTAVARELNRLLNAPKYYRWIGPEGRRVHRVRVYRIPPARVMPVTRMAA